jgi:hypothetical protein
MACDSTLSSYYTYSYGVGISSVLAFVGRPTTDVVTNQGHFLAYTQTCTDYYGGSSCFAKDGELGTLAYGQTFLAMAQEDDGQYIDGLVAGPPNSAGCNGTNCQLVRVNAVTRETISSIPYVGVTAGVYSSERLSMRFDGVNHRVYVLRQLSCAYYDYGCTSGYSIESFQLEPQ